MNYERDEARLRRLFEVGLLITSSLDLDEVLTRAMDLSRQVMEAECSLTRRRASSSSVSL